MEKLAEGDTPADFDEQKQRSISSSQYHYEIDSRINFAPTGPELYTFTASDREVYSLLSVLNPPDALAFLSDGVRTVNEVFTKLERLSAIDALVNHDELVSELVRRGISAEDATAGIMWTAFSYYDHRFDFESYEGNETQKHADAVELFTLIKGEPDEGHYAPAFLQIREDITQGLASLDAIKALIPEVSKFSQLASVSLATIDLNQSPRQYDFTLDDLKRFVRKASGFYESSLNRLTMVFAQHGIEAIERIGNLADLHNYIEIRDFERSPSGVTFGRETEDYRLALQATMYQQTLTKHRPLIGEEWTTVMEDAETLYQAGISLETALPYLIDHVPASKISGIVNGVQQGVAEGWL